MKRYSEISRTFATLRKQNEAALIIYLTAGYPNLKDFRDILLEVVNSGADIIEIGFPFSDPIADGSMIQSASQVALKSGVRLQDILELVKGLDIKIPLVLMSYLNPLLVFDEHRLFIDLNEAGINGVIIPDLPVQEAKSWSAHANKHKIDNILLVAPNSSTRRIKAIIKTSRGFIYCVSVFGTTGMRGQFAAELVGFLQHLRKQTDKPVAVGFGISNTDQIRALIPYCDGVILGSRIIKAIKEGEELGCLINELKQATIRR